MTSSEAATPQASGSPVSHTSLRHRLLAEVAAGCVMQVWSDSAKTRPAYRRRSSYALPLTAGETRALGVMARAGLTYAHARLGPSVGAPKRVDLSTSGHALFREWNTRWGDLTISKG